MTVAIVDMFRDEWMERLQIIGSLTVDGKLKTRRHHAEYGVQTPRQADLLANDVRVAIEICFPCVIGQNDDTGVNVVVLARVRTAAHGRNAEGSENIGDD